MDDECVKQRMLAMSTVVFRSDAKHSCHAIFIIGMMINNLTLTECVNTAT